jgi:hypothetical protein
MGLTVTFSADAVAFGADPARLVAQAGFVDSLHVAVDHPSCFSHLSSPATRELLLDASLGMPPNTTGTIRCASAAFRSHPSGAKPTGKSTGDRASSC